MSLKIRPEFYIVWTIFIIPLTLFSSADFFCIKNKNVILHFSCANITDFLWVFLKIIIINLIYWRLKFLSIFLYSIAYLREVDQHQETLQSDTDPVIKRRALLRVQQALIAAQEIGDEKLQIIQQVQDLIENKSRQLDLDYRNLGILFLILLDWCLTI